MKTLSVNTASWHYKLNVRMAKTNERLKRDSDAETYVRSKDNFCSYWRMTIWSMFKVLVTAAFVAASIFAICYGLYALGYAFMFHTKAALVSTAIVASLIGFMIAMFVTTTWLDNRRRKKLDKILFEGETETSLAKAKYSSWKNGVCVPVEFKA